MTKYIINWSRCAKKELMFTVTGTPYIAAPVPLKSIISYWFTGVDSSRTCTKLIKTSLNAKAQFLVWHTYSFESFEFLKPENSYF